MIVIKGQVFAIASNDDPCTMFMRSHDPDAVELMYWASYNGEGPKWWGVSLDAAEFVHGDGSPATWVCPD